MNEVQKSLFNLLLELDGICKKHDITYYLIGGSALGAIRHQGFLPWDDDADIVMTRDNWEKLKKAFETDLPPNRQCVGWHNCDDEPSVFFRYVDTTQTFILHSLWDHPMPWGGIIDIFVLNPLPVDQSKWDNYHKAMRRFGEYIMDTFILVNNHVSISAYLMDCLTGKLKSPAYVKNKLYSKLSQYDEKTCTHFSYLYARLHIVYAKEIFQEPRYVPFEGHMLPVPTLVEEHLRILFGDEWYNIPKDSDKITHVAQHDIKRSYLEYMHDYLHYTKRDYLHKRSMRAKVLKMFRAKLILRRDRRIALLRAGYLKKVFTAEYETRAQEFEALYQQGEFSVLYQAFLPYYSEQLLPVMQSSGVAIEIPARYLELALRTLIAAGYSRKAEKIMAIYKKVQVATEGFWNEITAIIRNKNDMFIAYENGDSNAEDLARELFAQFPYDRDVRLMMLWIAINAADSNSIQLNYLLDEAKIGEAQWPEKAEFKKARADILAKQGKMAEADNLYEEVIRSTNNGMMLLQISQMRAERGEANNDCNREDI